MHRDPRKNGEERGPVPIAVHRSPVTKARHSSEPEHSRSASRQRLYLTNAGMGLGSLQPPPARPTLCSFVTSATVLPPLVTRRTASALNCAVNFHRFRLAMGHSSCAYHASENVHKTGGSPVPMTPNENPTGLTEDDAGEGDAGSLVFSDAALDRLRNDPFLRLDRSRVELNAYFRWKRGDIGDGLSRWLAAEREEVFIQATQQLAFGATDRNGFVRASFYDHYRLLTSWRCGQQTKKVTLGPASPRICAICGASKPEATFRKEAHVIPDMFGCRELLSNEECDACNARSGETWENALGILTHGDRSFAGILGKGPTTPKLKVGKSYIGGSRSRGLTNIAIEDQQLFRLKGDGHAQLDLPYLAAQPVLAAKAIAKMAWLLVSPVERKRHSDILNWLLREDDNPVNLYHIWMGGRSSSVAAVWERVGDSDALSELIVMLAFGHVVLLWGTPDWSSGAPRGLIMPPVPKLAATRGELTALLLTARGDERTSTTKRTLGISFKSRRRLHLTNPMTANVAVHLGEVVATIQTVAVSPTGASPDRPTFHLSGGELVGTIEVADAGTGTWVWAYAGVPSEGDLTRTLDVLRGTLGGGVVDINLVDDGATLVESATFTGEALQNHHLFQLARMSYYLGVIARRLEVKIEFNTFTDDDYEQARWIALGLIHGQYRVDVPDGEVVMVFSASQVESLAEKVGDRVKNIVLHASDEVVCDVLGARIVVGARQLVLLQAKVSTSWNDLLSIAKIEGRVAVTFDCGEVAHVFEEPTAIRVLRN